MYGTLIFSFIKIGKNTQFQTQDIVTPFLTSWQFYNYKGTVRPIFDTNIVKIKIDFWGFLAKIGFGLQHLKKLFLVHIF